MKTALQAQMNQQIGMTPQLLQSIRLLHLSALEVEQEVARALDENPLLERVDAEADAVDDSVAGDETDTSDEVRADDAAAVEDFGDFIPGTYNGAVPTDLDPFENLGATETGGVRGRIRAQLRLDLPDRSKFEAACWMLDRIDDMGYLEMPREELIARAVQEFDLRPEVLEAIRQRILHCDPAGFGACDLRECLLVQLAEMGGEADGLELAIRIVADHLDLLARRDNAALAAALGTSVEEAAESVALILTLKPKPGNVSVSDDDDIVVPDVVVRRRGSGWHVALNARAAPRVRVDAATERLLAQSGNGADAKRMRDMLAEANWLSRSLSMRYETLLRTTRAIVERQAEFLDNGEESMRPLILREIAAAIGMHESSISRITTGKYMQTPRGTFELKYFFSARLDGAQVAGVAVRAIVKRLIETENRAAPLADDTIVALLARRGIRIARRTVAKYRDILNIASAKERAVKLPTAAFAAAC